MKGVIDSPDLKVKNVLIVVDKAAVVGVLKVSPINLDMKNDGEQHALHGFHQELLDTIKYPISLYSRQRPTDLDDYVNYIEGGEGFTQLRASYSDLCTNIGQDSLVATDHFVVLRVPAGKYSNTGLELRRRLKEVSKLLSGGNLGVSHVTGDELVRFAKDAVNWLPVPTRDFCATDSKGFDGYRKMLYVDEFPAELEFGWTRHLLRVDGLVDVNQVARPVKLDAAVRKLRRQSQKLDAEISVFLGSGRRGVNKLERSLDDVEWFLDLLARQECRPVKYGAYITVHGKTRRQAEETFQKVKSRLRTLQIKCKQPAYRNDRAYFTDSPFYPDRLDETLLMPSLSAATGFPFGTQRFEDSRGVLYGVDTSDEIPILLDRFSWNSHSMAVMGTLGYGKSYLAKLELLRSKLVYPDLRIIVVDPKKEYSSTVEAIGGKSRFIEKGKEYSFDPDVIGFEPRERGEFGTTAALAELVQQIYSHVSKNREKTIVLIDETHDVLDDEVGRRVLNQFVLEARDINTAVHMVSQSASHFTAYRKGREILDHVPGKLFFRHENVSDSMIDYFDLSDQEEWSIRQLRGGKNASFSEALLRVSNVLDTRIRIESTSLEHQIIEQETKPQKVVEWS